MNEQIVAVVPVRSLRNGKTRLASVLGPEERAALMRRSAAGVIGAARHSGVVATVLVVSPDSDVLTWAQGLGPSVFTLAQPVEMPGLIGAIDAGRDWALERGATALLSLFADLPLLAADDVRHLAADPRPLVLGADRRGEGTNALLLRLAPPGDEFRFAFGEGSLARHFAEAQRLGLETARLDEPGIAFDLDTPADCADYLDIAGRANDWACLSAQGEACAR